MTAKFSLYDEVVIKNTNKIASIVDIRRTYLGDVVIKSYFLRYNYGTYDFIGWFSEDELENVNV